MTESTHSPSDGGEPCVVAYLVCKDREEARRIGRALVEERLAACVNIAGDVESMYWWEGQVQDDREVVLLAKTTRTRFPSLEARARALHSYEVPCIVALPIVGGSDAYLAWLRRETAS